MDQTRLVVVEDSRKGHIVLNQLFDRDGISSQVPNLQLDREISLPFTGKVAEDHRATLEKIRAGIKNAKGPMMLALDLDLGLDEESGTIRSAVRLLTEEYLNRQIPGEITRQVDGLMIGVEAIKQTNIKPLLVVIQTSKGLQDENRNILQDFIKKENREHEVKVFVSPRYLSSSDANIEYASKLFNDADKAFQEFFGGQLDKFFRMLDEGANGDTTHNNVDKDPQAEAIRLLALLLELSEEEFTSQIWEKWQRNLTRPVTETIKSMGIPERERLSATAAWFFALAAFRHSKDPRDWREVFNVDDLLAPDLHTFYLTPLQSEPLLRRSIVCFYEMCLALFRSAGGDLLPGPLARVGLSKESGLRMLLNFDCAPPAGDDQHRSLYEQVGRWRNNSGGWQPMNKNEEARITSRAVWRFWLASSVGDKHIEPSDEDSPAPPHGIFGSTRMWRMNVFRRAEGRSEVVFNV